MQIRKPYEVKAIIDNNRGVGKVIDSYESDDQHWTFLLQQLAYPEIYRPVPQLLPTSDRTQIFNTSTGNWETRPVNANRGRHKKTSFTKKTAVTLIPADGKIIFFNPTGVNVGIVFDRLKVSWHGSTSTQIKYAFTTNAVTNNRFWIRGQPGSGNPWRTTTLQAIIDTNNNNISTRTVTVHNEVMGRLSRDALYALFARNDLLTARLNALHKKYVTLEWLKLDVPAFIITSDNPYSLYTYEQQSTDILEGLQREEKNPGRLFAIKLIRFIRTYTPELWSDLASKINKLRPAFQPPFFDFYRKSRFISSDVDILLMCERPTPLDIYQLLILTVLTENKSPSASIETKEIKREMKADASAQLVPALLATKIENGWLMHSMLNQQFEVAYFLLERFSRFFSKEELENALLHAILYKKIDLLNLFARHALPLNVNSQLKNKNVNLNDCPALHLTLIRFEKPPIEFITYLCSQGANTSLIHSGSDAIKLAVENKQWEVLSYFVSLSTISKNLMDVYGKEITGLCVDKDTFNLIYSIIRHSSNTTLIHNKLPELINFMITNNQVDKLEECYASLLLTDKEIFLTTLTKVAELKTLHGKLYKILHDAINNVFLLSHFSLETLDKLILYCVHNRMEHESRAITQQWHANKQVDKLFTVLESKRTTDKTLSLEPLEASLSAREKSGDTILSLAAKNGQLALITFYLGQEEKNPLAAFSSSQLGRVLLELVQNQHYHLALLLLNKRPDTSKINLSVSLNSPLHYLIMDDKYDINLFDQLIDDKQAIAIENISNETPLLLAIKHSRQVLIEKFLKSETVLKKYNVSQIGKILDNLVANKHYSYLELLIKNYGPLNLTLFLFNIISVTKDPDFTLLKIFTEKKPICADEKAENTLLSLAAKNNHIEIVNYFIQLEDKPSLSQYTPKKLGSAFIHLIERKQYETAALLIEKRADTDTAHPIPNSLNTSLHLLLADEKPCPVLFKKLTENNKILFMENKAGETPLIIALRQKHITFLPTLLDEKIIPAYSGSQIEKALEILTEQNHFEPPASFFENERLAQYSASQLNKIIHFLLLKNKIEVVERLLNLRKDIDHAALEEVFYFYIKTKNYDLALRLLTNKTNLATSIDPTTQNSVLHFLALEEKPNLDFQHEILKLTPHVNLKNSTDQTPVILAIGKNLSLLMVLLTEFTNQLDDLQINGVIYSILKSNVIPLSNLSQLLVNKQFIQKSPPFYLIQLVQRIGTYEEESKSMPIDPILFTHLRTEDRNDKVFVTQLTAACIQVLSNPYFVAEFIEKLSKLIKHIPCFCTRNQKDKLTHRFYKWDGEKTSHHWLDVIKLAKDRIMALAEKDSSALYDKDIYNFLTTPIEGKLNYLSGMKTTLHKLALERK